jgi:hypothetical protein
MKRLRSVTKRSTPYQSDPKRRRLFLLATALVARGMDAGRAYETSLHYVTGTGCGRTWISALAELDEVLDGRPDPIVEAAAGGGLPLP